MFDQLMESRPRRERGAVQASASIVAHTMIIAASIQLTRAVAATVVTTQPQTEMILARARTPATPHTASAAAAAIPAAPTLVALAPSISVPAAPPVADLTRGFDPGRLGGPGDPRGTAPGRTGDNSPDVGGVVTAPQVDEPAEYIDGPEPKYPVALRRVGIEGTVLLQYIVGIDGTIEPGSIQALKSSDRLFEAPAIDAIRQSHFKPARIKGRRVRQLVEQVVRFTLR
jgi:periplasmic protein TonB